MDVFLNFSFSSTFLLRSGSAPIRGSQESMRVLSEFCEPKDSLPSAWGGADLDLPSGRKMSNHRHCRGSDFYFNPRTVPETY